MNPFSIQRVHSKDRKKGIGSNHDPWMMIIIVIKRMKKNSTVTLGRNFKTLRDFEGLKWHASHVHALSFQAKNIFVSPLVFYLLRILCLKLYRVSYVTTVGTIVELTTCVFKICSSHMIKKKSVHTLIFHWDWSEYFIISSGPRFPLCWFVLIPLLSQKEWLLCFWKEWWVY